VENLSFDKWYLHIRVALDSVHVLLCI